MTKLLLYWALRWSATPSIYHLSCVSHPYLKSGGSHWKTLALSHLTLWSHPANYTRKLLSWNASYRALQSCSQTREREFGRDGLLWVCPSGVLLSISLLCACNDRRTLGTRSEGWYFLFPQCLILPSSQTTLMYCISPQCFQEKTHPLERATQLSHTTVRAHWERPNGPVKVKRTKGTDATLTFLIYSLEVAPYLGSLPQVWTRFTLLSLPPESSQRYSSELFTVSILPSWLTFSGELCSWVLLHGPRQRRLHAWRSDH